MAMANRDGPSSWGARDANSPVAGKRRRPGHARNVICPPAAVKPTGAGAPQFAFPLATHCRRLVPVMIGQMPLSSHSRRQAGRRCWVENRKFDVAKRILCDVSGMALLRHIPCSSSDRGRGMRRREFVVRLAGTAFTLATPAAGAIAQTPGKVYRLGLLTGGGSLGSAVDGLSRALASRG